MLGMRRVFRVNRVARARRSSAFHQAASATIVPLVKAFLSLHQPIDLRSLSLPALKLD